MKIKLQSFSDKNWVEILGFFILLFFIQNSLFGQSSPSQTAQFLQHIKVIKNSHSVIPVKEIGEGLPEIVTSSPIFHHFKYRWAMYGDTIMKHPSIKLHIYSGGDIPQPISGVQNIVLVFNAPFFDSVSFDAVITIANTDSISQDLVAQLVMGGLALEGEITKSKTRLGYCDPEYLGINNIELHDKLQSIIQEGLSQKAFPGCQLILSLNGMVFYAKAWGTVTYEDSSQITLHHIYDLASITKVSASIPALMYFYDQNRYRLTDSLQKVAPSTRNSALGQSKFEDFLTHQAGFTAWIPFYKVWKNKNGEYKRRTFSQDSSRNYPIQLSNSLFAHKAITATTKKAIINAPISPDRSFLYSDLGFYFVPEMIENLTDLSFTAFIQSTFYRPLGATTLCYQPLTLFPLHRIVPTENDTYFRKRLLHGEVHDEGAILINQGISGHAGLFGTAIDVAKLWQMYLNKGTYGGKQYVSDTTIATFTACRFCNQGNRRALGFDKPLIQYDAIKSSVAQSASSQSFGHTGFTGGIVWADPQYQLLMVFLSNRVYPSRDQKKLMELNIRPRIHQVVYDLLNSNP